MVVFTYMREGNPNSNDSDCSDSCNFWASRRSVITVIDSRCSSRNVITALSSNGSNRDVTSSHDHVATPGKEATDFVGMVTKQYTSGCSLGRRDVRRVERSVSPVVEGNEVMSISMLYTFFRKSNTTGYNLEELADFQCSFLNMFPILR